MVASRFAMTYPQTTSHVVFVNQIGMSDSRPGREWSEPSYDGERPTPQQYYRQIAPLEDVVSEVLDAAGCVPPGSAPARDVSCA
jgi:hypothetical protein